MSTKVTFYSCGCMQGIEWVLGGPVTRTLTHPCEAHAPTFEQAKAQVLATHAELFERLAQSELEDDRQRLLGEVWD